MIQIDLKWDEREYSKYKKGLIMMMVICIKQHLRNIWSSIHEKLSKTEAELKKALLIKKCVDQPKTCRIFMLRCIKSISF